MTKHIDINYREDDGRWKHEKVWFPDDQITGASGKKYSLGKYVNKGSNGTLFQCFDSSRKLLAIKFLHQLDEQRLERFEFESLVLSDMNHPNVLRFFDGGEICTTHSSTDVPFIITELFSGNLDFQIRNKQPVNPKDVLKYSLNLCDALIHIHEKGVIHRDIKPGNIFLSNQSGAVLGDFGLAKTSTDAGAERYTRTDVTFHSEFVGPVLWLSPELVAYWKDKDHVVDHRSDLFQVGLVMWYLLTAEIPRGGLDEADDPTKGAFFTVIQKLTKQKPERRYQSGQELKDALLSIKL